MVESVSLSEVRPLDEIQRQDMIDISVNTHETEFKRANIEVKEREFLERHEPYCSRCAIADFRRGIKDRIGEYSILSSIQEEQINRNRPIKLNMDDYGKTNRFELKRIRTIPSIAPDPATGMNYLTGYKVEYVCKIRGCRHILHLTIRDYERRVKDGRLKRIETDLPMPREYKPE